MFVHIPLKNHVSAPTCVMGDGPVGSDLCHRGGEGAGGSEVWDLWRVRSSMPEDGRKHSHACQSPRRAGGCDASL